MGRLLIFVHYNKYNQLSDYIVYLIEKMKVVSDRIIFVSNSSLSKINIEILKKHCDKIMQRENIGYDFGAWKDALTEEGWDFLVKYDSITLMNDSCFGPLTIMEKIYYEMEARKVDFWGITELKARKNGMPGTNTYLPRHIQSYFLCFQRNAILNPAFIRFWQDVEYFTDINNVIREYETQLTGLLAKSGLKYSVYATMQESEQANVDLALVRPDILLRKGGPLIKIKSILAFENPKYLIELIRELSDYPTILIESHITRTFIPNVSLKIFNKTIVDCTIDGTVNYFNNCKVAIHIHVSCLDIFKSIIIKLIDKSEYIDLYISTDMEDKKNEILKIMQRYNFNKVFVDYCICKYEGMNVFTWLSFSNKLKEYDLVGHLYTGKSCNVDGMDGEAWHNQVFETLINSVYKIVELFAVKPDMGILIYDVPFYFKSKVQHLWEGLGEYADMLWVKMKCNKEFDSLHVQSPIIPYSSMFWYRPRALNPLFELNLNANCYSFDKNISSEIIAKVVEKLLVYISWNEGFDYRIMLNLGTIKSNYELMEHALNIDNRIDALYATTTWKIGRLIINIPAKVMRYIKRIINIM
jgi:rhamnosyltransferase